mgnify:CR=1 FL=1
MKRPKLSFWQIWNMSFGFLGIQFGLALQNANASRILETFGADVEQLSWFWLAAPMTGLIVQPIIGHYSDRTWNRLGRRKPYFLVGAVCASLALIFMPNASGLAHLIAPLWIGAGTLMILDASINVSMEPFRALVADMLPDEQRTLGFSVQTALIGIGAVVGSLLPYALGNWLGIPTEAEEGQVPMNVVVSFYVGAIVFISAILWTITRTTEYPPEVLKQFHDGEAEEEESAGLLQIFKDFANMPKTMRQLGLVQFFSWFALFSMWVFTHRAIAGHVWGVSVDDSSSAAYNEAGNWVPVMFGVYNFVSAVYAFLLPKVTSILGRKKAYAYSLLIGGLGLVSMYFMTDKWMLLIPMVGVGIAWTSILAMPYAMLAGSIPAGKMGIYMGIFNFFIVIPQIINGIIGGPIVKNVYNSQAIYAIVIAGICFLIAATAVFFVEDKDEQKIAS